MEKLEDFKKIKLNLKTSSTNAIKVVHKIIFDEEGDRGNRKQLRQFTGFHYPSYDDIDFKTKVECVTSNFSSNELITVCNVLNIKYDGTKPEVVERIVSSLNDLSILRNNTNVDEYESDNEVDEISKDNQQSQNMPTVNRNESSLNQFGIQDCNQTGKSNSITQCQHNVTILNDIKCSGSESIVDNLNMVSRNFITFSDMEAAMQPFHGNVLDSDQKSIADFEDISQLFQLSDIYKLIFAKRLLTGKAKLFIQGESGSWNKLKTLLINEFGEGTNSAELHTALFKRRMCDNELVEEYFFTCETFHVKEILKMPL